MKLAVFGPMKEAVITAAFAALNANERVDVITPSLEPGSLDLAFTHGGAAAVHVHPYGSGVDADAFLIMAERADTYRIVSDYKKTFSGRPLLLAPGGVGITEIVAEKFEADSMARPMLAQSPGFPAIGSLEGRRVELRGIKKDLLIGALAGVEPAAMQELYGRWLPDLMPASVVLASLSNTNNILHPTICLVNASRVENREPFEF
jgi:hypothetical protein